MKQKNNYIIGILVALAFLFYMGGGQLQSAMQSFTTDDVGGWFSSLGQTTQNFILIIIGLITFLVVIGFLMKN